SRSEVTSLAFGLDDAVPCGPGGGGVDAKHAPPAVLFLCGHGHQSKANVVPPLLLCGHQALPYYHLWNFLISRLTLLNRSSSMVCAVRFLRLFPPSCGRGRR